MVSNPLGTLSLVLHCHLPFVRNPEHEYFLEENWYYEAIFETYLPLLSKCEEMVEKNIPFKITLSLSPTLLSMWVDPLLRSRALRYVDNLLVFLEKEKERVKPLPDFQPVVEMYLSKLKAYRHQFAVQYQGDITRGFKALQDLGRIELMTCAATHGYLPLLAVKKEAIRAQVATAISLHETHFGRKPSGFWLPECGYQPGLEEILDEFGIRYFLLDTHGLVHATPRPRYGTFAPSICPNGIAVFARDLESSKQVWSSKEGYPGDPDYRDFYRDVGFDLDEATLAPFQKPEGIRRFTGLKYYRVTGPFDAKEPYDPARGLKKAQEHAADFLSRRAEQMKEAGSWMDRLPQVTCMYDAELFGHWWYEGPDFLFSLFEQNRAGESGIGFSTLIEYLDGNSSFQTVQPAASSWGLGGYSEFWLNEANDWIYPLLNKACAQMVEMTSRYPQAKGWIHRALNQAARELLLAQASDWAFMMKTGNHRAYAESRVKGHLFGFSRLYDQVSVGKIDRKFLEELEERENLFPDLDYRIYQKL